MSAAPKFTCRTEDAPTCEHETLCVLVDGEPAGLLEMRNEDAAAFKSLIAAEPDLFAALQTLADYAEARERVGDDAVPERLQNLTVADMADAIMAARGALAKARGES